MKSKAKGCKFWTSEGDQKQAEICYQHWEAMVDCNCNTNYDIRYAFCDFMKGVRI